MKTRIYNRNLTVAFVLGAGAVAYIFLLFLPTQCKLTSLQEELSQHQLYIAQNQDLQAKLVSLDTDLRATRSYTKSWQSQAPRLSRLAPTYSQITSCAADAGVKTIRFEPHTEQPLATLARLAIALECQGQFSEVFELLRKLEALPQAIWLEDVHFTQFSEDGELVRCVLVLAVFADNRDISN